VELKRSPPYPLELLQTSTQLERRQNSNLKEVVFVAQNAPKRFGGNWASPETAGRVKCLTGKPPPQWAAMKGNTIHLGLSILTQLWALCWGRGDGRGREAGNGKIYSKPSLPDTLFLPQNVSKTFGRWFSPGPPGSFSFSHTP